MKAFDLLARAGLSIFFDRIEIEGAARVPRDGPLLIVANHTNGLVDGLLLASTVPREVTLTAKSALGKNPFLAAVVWLANAVTIYRPQDDRSETARNAEAFAEVRARWKRGGAVCVFPEGISHSDAGMRTFKTGAARMALDFVASGGRGLRIVPAGLHYAAKQRFRSAVLVRFGEPIDVDALAESERDPRVLTSEIEGRIRALTLNFASLREALWLRWTATLLGSVGADPAPLDAPPASFANETVTVASLREAYAASDRDRVAAILRDLRRYRRDLKRHGIQPAEVWLPLHPFRAAFFVLRELELIVLGFPILCAGVVQHGLAFAIDRVVTRMTSKDLDHWASNAIFYGFLIFPVIWIAGIALTAMLTSRWYAALYALALPFTLVYTVLYTQRFRSAVQRARTFLTFVFRRSLQRDLRMRGRQLAAEIGGSVLGPRP